MPRNDDGEFELILGNKQIISVFFLVVILLGVFFTLGYIVGRSSGPLATVDTAANRKPSDAPLTSGGKSPLGAEVAAAAPPKVAVRAPAVEPDSADEPEKPVIVDKPKRDKPKLEDKLKLEEKPKAAVAPHTEPQAGQTFLQLLAGKRAEAELEADILRKRGFPTLVAPVPESPLFRVLIGPLPDSASISRTRADLEAKGLPKGIIRKY